MWTVEILPIKNQPVTSSAFWSFYSWGLVQVEGRMQWQGARFSASGCFGSSTGPVFGFALDVHLKGILVTWSTWPSAVEHFCILDFQAAHCCSYFGCGFANVLPLSLRPGGYYHSGTEIWFPWGARKSRSIREGWLLVKNTDVFQEPLQSLFGSQFIMIGFCRYFFLFGLETGRISLDTFFVSDCVPSHKDPLVTASL